MKCYPRLKAIVAVSRNGVIGQNNRIPWHISDELKFFKCITLNNIVLMGRKTFDSIRLPLRDRKNWILTRSESFQRTAPAGISVFKNLEEVCRAISDLDGDRQVWVIGGANIYRQLLPLCSELVLTEIKRDYVGDCHWCGHSDLFDRGDLLFEHADFTTYRWVRKN